MAGGEGVPADISKVWLKWGNVLLNARIHLKKRCKKKAAAADPPPPNPRPPPPLTLGEFTPIRGKCYRNGKWKQTNIYNMSGIKHVFSHIALESEPLLLGSLTPTLQMRGNLLREISMLVLLPQVARWHSLLGLTGKHDVLPHKIRGARV